jgi:rare lipoprotein A (peptidoglycan hydrolase)
MKRWIGLSLLLVPFLVSAAGFWDGNAALQRGDAAFESGLYAASNSFPKDTRILIENLDTGKTSTATITERIEGRSDILVLLSPKTAEALGIEQGTLASVRVTVTSSPNPAPAQPSEQAYSLDPDLNPAAGYPSDRTADTGRPSLESLPATQAPAALAEAPLPASTPESPPAAEQTPADQQTDEAIAAAAAARTPQKQLFLPPREDQKFVYHKPAETPAAQTAQAAPAETQPTITAVIGEPSAKPAPARMGDVPLAEAAAPEESRPQEIVSAGPASPPIGNTADSAALLVPEPQAEEQPAAAPEPVQTEVSSPAVTPSTAPEAPKLALASPEAPSPAQAAVAPVAKAAAIPRIAKADTYYLQLGAYASEKIAQDLAASLPATYPALVVAPAGAGTGMFRVLIGPLNRAESGTVLTRFKYRGFPDAFLKRE